MDLTIPDIDALLKSPQREEEDSEIGQINANPGPYEQVAKKTAGALHRIRASLAKAKVKKNNRKGVLEPTISLIAALNEQAAEIGRLQAKVSHLEAAANNITDLKAQVAYHRVENEKLKNDDISKAAEIASLTEQNILLKAENTMLAQKIAQAAASPALPPPAEPKRRTFANVLKSQLPKISNKRKFVSLVYPKDENTSSEETKSTLFSSIAPSKINVGVKHVKKVQNGGVAVECTTEEQLDKIIKEINSNPSLQGKVETRPPVRRDPKIIIYDVDIAVSKESFLQTFCQQNNVETEKISGTFSLKSKTKDKVHWVLQTDPKVFKTLMRGKKVYFEWARLSIREFLRPTRCYKCNRYGHISTKCEHEETCPRCGEEGHNKRPARKKQNA
ncbi:hypothetical protein AVEN_235980-1 [Araneus ventricosus]|uniref:CCHC-type domain-containing protein n=1 Tax=Araneus ventricosus TaxID=182803 RepID=A0A4Y2SWF7_ARAVE|nr:hypothetical protein AVEN_235980-1 [Araneus ventricosus]